ncbi:MAG: hypothetical protein MZV49_23065 [Rhodopseudomonas palustris]|nr:hypothetical protein [Rhodopseudomonas palustris]
MSVTRHFVTTIAAAMLISSAAAAQTIYPIDRAEMVAGAKFDLKVEFAGEVAAGNASLTINGTDVATLFGKAPELIAREDGKPQSALLLRELTLPAGHYQVQASDGSSQQSVRWTVYDTAPRRAKNVILFIGDGLSPAHRIAARLLSKGIREGKSPGQARDRRHAANGAGRDRRLRSHHHRLGQCRQRLCHRPQDRGQRHGRLCRSQCQPVR